MNNDNQEIVKENTNLEVIQVDDTDYMEDSDNFQFEETNCQRFTPDEIANFMADQIKFNDDLLSKRILENSFGDGSILASVIRKILEYFTSIKLSKKRVKHFLENNIVGYEIDQNHIDKCKSRLDNISIIYGYTSINWKLIKEDYLFSNEYGKFDYIIGNPPYISHRNMCKYFPKSYITKLKKNYSSCEKGAFDYSFPFTQKSFSDLNPHGKLIYILPNSLFKNKSASTIRGLIKNDLIEVIDFSPHKLFVDALVAVSILVISKESNKDKYDYYKFDNISKQKKKEQTIIKSITTDKFIFTNSSFNDGDTRFGDLFNASMTIATLLNEAFLINENELPLYEPELIIRAHSPKNIQKKHEYIIFPYQIIHNSIQRIGEDDLKNNYPRIYSHLMSKKSMLENRKIDIHTSWFEYGRTQGLNNVLNEKLLMSSMVTKQIRMSLLDRLSVAYAGIWIITKSIYSLDVCYRILSDQKFIKYVERVGSNASGTSMRIKSTDVNNYRFNISDYI